ncbi:MAG: glycoside hydrolase family 3 protein [Selenomonadaceae bacterium]|nr:glycoside hydrolase family 3 protein [Selenomonadaceae bacterium]
MKKIFALMLMMTFLMTGCGATKEVQADVVLPPTDPVEKILQSMTLEEKIGQMMMVGVYGTQLNDDIIYSLNAFHFGGIIYYDRNLENVAQAKKFSDDLNAAANQKLPLLISIDEEGGRVARGKDFLQAAPSQEEIGLTGNFAEADYWARHNAKILKSIGVNINLAPVADVGSRDTRSFGDNAFDVANFVDAAAHGYESENFLYTLKHFPGIGKSKIDPHVEVSNVEDSKEILDVEDLPPFKQIIRGHDHSNFMIMVGHLKYDAIDPVNSASLSPAVMTGLLRDELGFKGVVITDDLEMGAIKNKVDLSLLGVKMILAGGDIALVCHNYESQQTVYNGILDAVKRGEISEDRINDSVRRIIRLKAHL